MKRRQKVLTWTGRAGECGVLGVMPALCAPPARAGGYRSDCCVTNEPQGLWKGNTGTGMQAALIPRWF